VLGILGVVLFFLVFTVFKIKNENINEVKAVAMIISNVVNMLQLVILLAYGLFNMPIYLWKCADNKQILYKELQRAYKTKREYRESLNEYRTIIS
jgi:hypothetical protein